MGDLPLDSGGVLPGARLSWKTHGALSPAGDNAILYPTSYGAQHQDLEWLIGPDGVLDPTRWFVIQADQFAGGLSTSPSTTPDYPALVTAGDNVRAQARMLDAWGVGRLACVYGWSMGGLQAYHWAALFPGRVARIYASGALSQDFYRAGLHLTAMGAPDLETFLVDGWERRYDTKAAANLYAQLKTWHAADIAGGGDLPAALRAITARVLLLPGETDLYFRVADNVAELPHLAHAELRPIPSVWGHRAGNPVQNPADQAFLHQAVHAWLET